MSSHRNDLSTPVVLHNGTSFWRVKVDGLTVVTFRGKGHGDDGGRRYSKTFVSHEEALVWAIDSIAARTAEGYHHRQNHNHIPSSSTSATSASADVNDSNMKPTSLQCDKDKHAANVNNDKNVFLPCRSGRKRNVSSLYFPDPSTSAKPTEAETETTRQKTSSSSSLAAPAITAATGRTPSVTSSLATSDKRIDSMQPVDPSIIRTLPSVSFSMPERGPEGPSDVVEEPPLKKVKRGMGGTKLVDTTTSLGVVDSASGLSGEILTNWGGGSGRGRAEVYDVMLVLVDMAKNHDKFIVIQLIDDVQQHGKYYVYERWGRTGMMGQSLTLEYARTKRDVAIQKFESIFLKKTGLEWDRATIDPPVTGKYRVVKQDYSRKQQMERSRKTNAELWLWQYWVDDGVDGKGVGWYNYDKQGSFLVEQLYSEFQTNTTWLSRRVVKSGTFSYLVDLSAMTQTNVDLPNGKTRRIRRSERSTEENGSVELNSNGIGNNADIDMRTIDDINMATSATVDKDQNNLLQQKQEAKIEGKEEEEETKKVYVMTDVEGEEKKQQRKRSLANGKLMLAAAAATTNMKFPGKTSTGASTVMATLGTGSIKSKPKSKPTPKSKPEHKVEPIPNAIVLPSIWSKLGQAKAKVKTKVKQEEHEIEAATPAAKSNNSNNNNKNYKKGDNAETNSSKIDVDSHCPNAVGYLVVGRRDATLNQTDITGKNNNNKYYRLQLLQRKDDDRKTGGNSNCSGASASGGGSRSRSAAGSGIGSGTFHVWTRWGRVGEVCGAQMKLLGPFSGIGAAEKVFNRKFREKTGIHWNDRTTRGPIQGKYELLTIDHSVHPVELLTSVGVSVGTDNNNKRKSEHVTKKKKKGASGIVQQYEVLECKSKLDNPTKELIELLFEENLYVDTLKEFDIDVRKMPLGKLTPEQINKGVNVLKEIERKLQSLDPCSSGLVESAQVTRAAVEGDAELKRLSSRFYTALPHDFGRRRPPVINNHELLQKSYDMCNVLHDVEKAKAMIHAAAVTEEDEKLETLAAAAAAATTTTTTMTRTTPQTENDEKNVMGRTRTKTRSQSKPKLYQQSQSQPKAQVVRCAKADVQYALLHADLTLLQEGDKELEMVRAAFEATKGGMWSGSGFGMFGMNFSFGFGGASGSGNTSGTNGHDIVQMFNVWRVNRHGEGARFRQMVNDMGKNEHKQNRNHQLLWHGSHIGCISAILLNGLRIQPHSSGRCGRGIYLASEHNKSLHYTRPAAASRVGCVFLAQAALGTVCETMTDRTDLTSAPQGFDSVKACGRQSPNPDEATVVTLHREQQHVNDNGGAVDGSDDQMDAVLVPTAKPVLVPRFQNSAFTQDEFVVYKEEQVRIRYIITVKF